MDKTAYFFLAFLCLMIFIGAILYGESTRYEIVTAAGIAYKLDRKTGQVWYVTRDVMRLIPSK